MTEPDAYYWKTKGDLEIAYLPRKEKFGPTFKKNRIEVKKPLYGPDTILEIAPRGMNMTEFVCNNCGYSGVISKQLTDGYDPYCFRCGEQELTETREFSMLNMNRFKTIFTDKAEQTERDNEC